MKTYIFLTYCLALFSVSTHAYDEVYANENIDNLTSQCMNRYNKNLSDFERDKLIHLKSIELEIALENERNLLDLAFDANKTSRVANVIGTSSIGLLITALGIPLTRAIGPIAVAYRSTALSATLPVSIIISDLVLVAKAGIALGDLEPKAQAATKRIMKVFSQSTCDFSQIYKILDAKQTEIYNQMDDKFFELKNSLRFGTDIRDLTRDLYITALLKRLVIQSEINNLKD